MQSNVLEPTPPLTLTDAEAKQGLDILDQAIEGVENGKFSDEDVARFSGW